MMSGPWFSDDIGRTLRGLDVASVVTLAQSGAQTPQTSIEARAFRRGWFAALTVVALAFEVEIEVRGNKRGRNGDGMQTRV